VWEGGLEVVEVRTERQVQVRARFVLPNGESVDALMTSKSEGKPPPKRNGNAMNHSQGSVLAVLDLEEFNWAQAQVKVDGATAGVRQLAPFLPFAWRLEQAAGGLSVGGLWMSEGDAPGLLAERAPNEQELRYEASRSGDRLHLRQGDALLETTWTFEQPGGSEAPMELRQVEVMHGEISVFRLVLNPALPDLRYLPEAPFEAKIVAGSNGLRGYMNGTLRLGGKGGDVLVDVLPEAPAWACERPVRNRLSYVSSIAEPGQPTGVRLSATIEPALAAGGSGPEACW